jgi:hypothetical protein
MKAGGTLRAMVRAGLWIAGAGSLACTLYTGRHNPSVLLMALFAVWVVSPFGGLAWAEREADRAPSGMAAAMRASILAISICSLGLYIAVAAGPQGRHTAFAFLAVPTVSWLATLPMVIAARVASRR